MTQGRAPPPVTVLVLAAGASRRMRGVDKLLEPVAGQPLLRRIVGSALGTGAPVLVALPRNNPARRAALAGLAASIIPVANTQEGMANTLRKGVAALPRTNAVMVLLADMPEIDTSDLATMIAVYCTAPQKIHRATSQDGVPGHPVIFPPWAHDDLLALQGDAGARAVVTKHARAVIAVPLTAAHATTDLDTPEDWAKWRAASNGD
ncbi:nucleotidyltransferase family protein [Pseudorhodobacter aquimaris]|uniref:nucleotidyltransferase family protein n=1 Tax=Pseudorhodobacter aquimaris TaxID=687412 RepID=UPI00067AA651|nr:nucleotidyltransferase family protein [Pseudorhodobacter aquimaris]